MEEPKNTIQLFHIAMNKGEYDKIHTTQIRYNTHCLHFTVYSVYGVASVGVNVKMSTRPFFI